VKYEKSKEKTHSSIEKVCPAFPLGSFPLKIGVVNTRRKTLSVGTIKLGIFSQIVFVETKSERELDGWI
jgi:hypothetical protein